MESFKAVYVEKCRDFLCEPIGPLLEAVDNAIANGLSLTTIRLNGNSKELFNKRVEYMQVFALAEALHDATYVTELDLSYNNVDDAGVATLARLLKFNKSLKMLKLEGNSIGPDGAAKLAAALADEGGGGGGIEVLILNFNPIGEDGGQAMAKMLRTNTTLRVLDIGNCEVGMKSLVSIATALNEVNRTLLYLDIENPRLYSIQEEGTLHFARMLATNNVIKACKFGKFDMRDHGILTLVSYGLINNFTLTMLDLSCNALTEEAGAPLARLITDNSVITSISLASNRLNDNGAVAIANALPYNSTLRKLDLSFNTIEEKGLLALADKMRLNNSVVKLNLWGNHFAPSSSAAFLNLLEAKKGDHVVLKTDFEPYIVNEKIYVAKVDAVGPKQHDAWAFHRMVAI